MIVTRKDLAGWEQRKRATFVNCLSGFKSANLIGTADAAGQSNLAIVSSTFHLGADPALIGFVIRPDSVTRHTLDNLRETGVCTLNHVHSHFWREGHQTSARYPREQSEFEAVGLTQETVEGWGAPFVKESKIRLALKLLREIKIDENGVHLIVSQIEFVSFEGELIGEDGFLDLEAAKTITVSGLDSYHETSRLGRLPYAKP